MVIGVANIIPGVSGGTMAFIFGILDQLTEALGEWLTNKEKRLSYTVFLFFVAAGAITGILIFARIFRILLESPFLSQPTYLFFAGLIAGSLPFLINTMEDKGITLKRGALFLLAASLVVLTTVLKSASAPSVGGLPEITGVYGLWLVVCGFLAAGSMIVPGFSGSALLVSLGEYHNILLFVDQRMLLPVALVGIGAVGGILVVARIIDIALKRAFSGTMYFIIGLVVASFYALGLEVGQQLNLSPMIIIASVITFCLGCLSAYGFSKISRN